jgi:pimeloyl-ACP methyl ester carboxylesterase
MLTGIDVDRDPLVVKRRIEIGTPLEGDEPLAIAAEVHVPEGARSASRPVVLFCLPGGGTNKQYFDLAGGASDHVYSFAREMAARGFFVAVFDPIGVGESSRPKDGFTLTTEAVVRCQASAVERLTEELRNGMLAEVLPPLPELMCIGVGHSMGAMLTIVQQVSCRDYAALVLLCFGTMGLPSRLTDLERDALAKYDGGRGELVELAKRRFGGDPYPKVRSRGQTDSPAARALGAAQDAILAIPAMQSIMPGSVRSEAATIDVPVFLAVCEKDMTGPPHVLPAEYPACNDLTLVVLKVAGHHPFVAAGGEALFDRLATWLDALICLQAQK